MLITAPLHNKRLLLNKQQIIILKLPSNTSYWLMYHITRHTQPTTHKQGKAVAESGKMIGVRKCNVSVQY